MSEGTFTYDVFLSHSSKDKAIVRNIAERLKKDGVKVWFDEWEIKPGDSIPAKVEEGLENSRVLVLCMSANAFGSDWAQLESYAFRFRDPLNKERRFLTLRLDETDIKGSLAQFRYINWLPSCVENGYVELLSGCVTSAPSEQKQTSPSVFPKTLVPKVRGIFIQHQKTFIIEFYLENQGGETVDSIQIEIHVNVVGLICFTPDFWRWGQTSAPFFFEATKSLNPGVGKSIFQLSFAKIPDEIEVMYTVFGRNRRPEKWRSSYGDFDSKKGDWREATRIG